MSIPSLDKHLHNDKNGEHESTFVIDISKYWWNITAGLNQTPMGKTSIFSKVTKYVYMNN